MISFSIDRPAIPLGVSGPWQCLGAAAIVTACADWLFYLHTPGISVVIFVMALSIAVLLANPVRASRGELAAAIGILVTALLPSIEDFGVLPLAFAVAGAAVFALLVTGWPAQPVAQRVGDVIWMITSGPFRLAGDLGTAFSEAWEGDTGKRGINWLIAWIVPLGLGGMFLGLFSRANPLIEHWFSGVETSSWKNLDLMRPLFWLAVIAAIWPLLWVRLQGPMGALDLISAFEVPPAPQPAGEPQPAPVQPAEPGALFGKAAILRSLVLFNALFAVQSVLDITYLWGGLALPDGMSYASYAHHGAYLLIVTALLAGAFVLAAMRSGTSAARSRLIRALVFLWIGQNVLLVFSSMFRLNLYVDVYSLTGWRCAAFVWMLLVAAGLVLIVARIALDRSNTWLLWSNAAVLVLTLYFCSLVDFPGLIADFNVVHSREVSGTGSPIDIKYLCELGPAALPALDKLLEKGNAQSGWHIGNWADLPQCRDGMAMTHRMTMGDWRAWTFRGRRLLRYLHDHGLRTSAGVGRPIG